MIGIKLQGRLGNQMFQTAFICALGRHLNVGFFLVQKPWREVLILKYFSIKGFTYFDFLWRLFKGYYLTIINSIGKQEISNYVSPESQLHLLTDKKLYSGFFQSEIYFLDQVEYIKNLFKIKKKYVRLYNDTYASVMKEKKSIVIHIRRGDYLKIDGKDHSLPTQYYLKCLSLIDDNSNYRKLFISDDIEWAKQQFSNIPDSIFCSNHMMIDFQILTNADIILVANSSFSWWGAWLNRKNAVVYAPKYWLGYLEKETYPVGILCNNWISID